MITLESIYNPAHLCLAAKKARKYLLMRQWYHDRASQEAFCGALTFRAWQLSQELATGTYSPEKKIVFAAPKNISRHAGGERYSYRPLAVQKFKDEVVQTAIVMRLADSFEKDWGDPEKDHFPQLCSYGNRIYQSRGEDGRTLPHGSSHLYRDWPEDYAKFVKETASHFNDTLRACRQREYVAIFSSDISNFFPSIDRRVLIDRVVAQDTSADLLDLVRLVFGNHDVVGCEHSFADAEALRIKGLLQGPVHSGFWANVYLSTFDVWMRTELAQSLCSDGLKVSLTFYGRYVDDFHAVLKLQPAAGSDLVDSQVQELIVNAVSKYLAQFGLDLSSSKTSLMLQDGFGSLLTTGQIAERMAVITRKAYFPMPPEELVDLEAEVRMMFGARLDQADQGAVPGARAGAPILDNPGVRDASRKRFAAGKWLRVAKDLERIQPGWLAKNRDFASEFLREWLSDPTQVQLLQRALEVGLKPPDVKRLLTRLNSFRTKSARPFYDFVWSYLIHLDVFSNKNWPINYSSVINEAIASGSHPVLVQRALAWRLKFKRAVTHSELKIDPLIAGDYGSCRKVLWGWQCNEFGGTPYELGSIISGVKPSDRVLKSLVSKALSAVDLNDRPQLLRSVLLRRPLPMADLAQGWSINVPELEAFNVTSGAGDPLLFRKIIDGKYRNPVAWFGLAKQLGLLLQHESNRIGARRGLVHPFSLVEAEVGGELKLIDSPPILTAYSTGAESREDSGSGWAYAVGLILRAAASGSPRDLIGVSPIHRFSMAGTFLWLAARTAKMGTQAADLLDRLAWWPGSSLLPFPDVEAFIATVEFLAGEVAHTMLEDAILSDVNLHVSAGQPTPRAYCVALCQLRAAPSKVSDSTVRRALAITRSILREKNVENGVNLIVFPEMSVPRASIGTLCRFSRVTGCVILAGLELLKDGKKKCQRNELVWIVPIDTRSGRVAVLRQEKIFPTTRERHLKPPVRPAEPPVVWRIKSGLDRMAAINCFEFTYLPLRELLRGRVELMVVSANNQDVTTFDNLVESTHYDLYSHVVLINSEHHGGSAIRAPYRAPRDRRIFDIHGADLFSVNVCFVDLRAFRGGLSKKIKSRPAGFKVQ